jgi:hypothetical protein
LDKNISWFTYYIKSYRVMGKGKGPCHTGS